jgi:hypothetical protein
VGQIQTSGQLRNPFEENLTSWVREAPENERANRVEAKIIILLCRKNNYSSLNLTGLDLTTLPEAIGNLTQLTSLDLSDNRLITLPEAVVNLTQLTRLNLSDNQLTTLPEAIGNLTQLTTLDLSVNRLTTLPDAIGNLTQLTNLNIYNNRLTTLPDTIGNLTRLTSIDLRRNQLTTLPETIGNLTQLRTLDLDFNQLTTLPASLFTAERSGQLNLNALSNHFTAQEVQRLGLLAQGRNIVVYMSIHDNHLHAGNNNQFNLYSHNLTADQSQQLLTAVINAIREENRQAVATFLNLENNQFTKFISECSRTAGYQNHQSAMISSLGKIVDDMQINEDYRAKCLAIAETALNSCGDRVALAYTQMLIAQNNDQTPIAEMSEDQLIETARKEAIVNFLNDKAETRIAEIKKSGGFLDEIETYLAYLQAAPSLGFKLPETIDMLYRFCSNVSHQDLENANNEFRNIDINSRIANHIYHDDFLKTHPIINGIIRQVGERTEFDSYKMEGETSQEYLKRTKDIQSSFQQAVINEITDFITINQQQKSSISQQTSLEQSNQRNPNPNNSSLGSEAANAVDQEEIRQPSTIVGNTDSQQLPRDNNPRGGGQRRR